MAGDVYLLVGFPGSGKTTWANNLSKDKYAIISTDELSKMFRNIPKEKRRAFEIALAKEHLQKGTNVVFDKMLMSKEARKNIIKKLRPYAGKIYVVLFSVPLLECLKRNSQRPSFSKVSDKSYFIHIKKYEKPAPDEGYDKLIEVKE